jgi:hypothetical protein
MTDVRLLGGPAHSLTVEVEDSRTPLSLEGPMVPDGCVARYRPADGRRKTNHAYRFEGLSKIEARLPLPGAAA